PREGLWPDRPQALEGIRMEPPPSEPVARGTIPDARAAAAPPELPPALRSRSHGFRVAPKGTLSVWPFHPSSGVLVLPTTMHPAAFRRATSGESSVAGGSSTCSA